MLDRNRIPDAMAAILRQMGEQLQNDLGAAIRATVPPLGSFPPPGTLRASLYSYTPGQPWATIIPEPKDDDRGPLRVQAYVGHRLAEIEQAGRLIEDAELE